MDYMDPDIFKGSYSQIILGWILMIIQELRSLGGGLRSLSVLVINVFFGKIFARGPSQFVT